MPGVSTSGANSSVITPATGRLDFGAACANPKLVLVIIVRNTARATSDIRGYWFILVLILMLIFHVQGGAVNAARSKSTVPGARTQISYIGNSGMMAKERTD